MSEETKISVGLRVTILNKPELGKGYVKYIGLTKFAEGRWVGIELDGPNGKNDGTVKGDKYFDCKPNHGIFVRSNIVIPDGQQSQDDSHHTDTLMPTLPPQTTTTTPTTTTTSTTTPSTSKSGIRPPSSTGVRPPTTSGTTTTSGIRPPSSVGNRPSSGSVSGSSSTTGIKKPTESGIKKPSTSTTPTTTSTGSGSTSTTPHTSRPSSPTPTTEPVTTTDEQKKTTTTTTTTRPPSSTSARPPSSGSVHPTTTTKPSQPPKEEKQPELTLEDLNKSTGPSTSSSSLKPPSTGIRPPSSTGSRSTTSTSEKSTTSSGIKPPTSTSTTTKEDDKVEKPTTTATSTSTSSGIKPPTSSGIKPPTTSTSTSTTSFSELTTSQLTGSNSSLKKSKIMAGEDEDEKEEDEKINDLLNKSLVNEKSLKDSVVDENVEKMMAAINELTEFKLKSQDQINDLQNTIRELSSQKDKSSREYEKQIQQLEKSISQKEKEYDNLLKSQHKSDESAEKQISKEKELFEKEKEQFNEQISSLNDTIELLTLDKELTEEKLELSQTELEQVQEELELLKVEFENVKIQLNASSKTPQIDESLPTDVGVLQEQNEKLKETLVKLRDMALSDKHEFAKKSKDYEQSSKQLQTANDKIQKLELDVALKLEEILEYKLALEDAESQEALITDLTEKNLELNEEVDELKGTLSDLEAFKDLSEELTENQVALEKSLRHDLYAKEVENLNLNGQLANQALKISEAERTIQQFRELVGRLQHKIEEMKKREDEQYEQNTNFTALQQQLLNKNQQLQNQVIRATALEIDHQLDTYKAKEAELHLSFINEYLPEQTFQSDNDSIKLLLTLKRIVLKSELAQKYLNRTYKVEEISQKLLSSTGQQTESDELVASSNTVAHSLQVIHILDHLIISATWLSETLEHCSVDNWLKSGRSTKDINRQEQILDQLLGLIKEEQYGLGYSSQDLEKITVKLDSILANVFGETQIYKSEWSMILNHILNIQYYLKQIMLNDINISNTIQSNVPTFPQKDISKLLSICRKVFKNLLTKPSLKHSTVIRDILKFSETSCSSILNDLVQSIPKMRDQSINQEILIAQMNTRVESILLSNSNFTGNSKQSGNDEFELDGIISQNQVNEDTLSPLEKLFNRLIVQLNDIVESILAGDLNEDSKQHQQQQQQQQQKPWVIRSIQLKQSLGEVGTLYNTIAAKEQELLENLKALKTKDAELIEEKRKEESFDKRIKTLQKSENELNAQLEKEREVREKNEKQYKQAIAILRKDHSDLDQENKTLKQKNTNLLQEQKKMQVNLNSLNQGIGNDVQQLRQADDIQVVTLKKSIRYLRQENQKLKHQKSLHELSQMLPEFTYNIVPKEDEDKSIQDQTDIKPTSPLVQSKPHLKFNEILEYSKLVGHTMNQILETAATPKVLDISGQQQQQQQQSSSSSNGALAMNEIEKLKQIEKQQVMRVQLLQSKMTNIISSQFGSFGLQNYTDPLQSNMLKQFVPKPIGKVSIPLLSSTHNSLLQDDDIRRALSSSTVTPSNLLFTNQKSFNEIHQVFVN
ncbi:dynactin [Tieghemostelium lacteum]|uniref:Dynactin n=1 Tax=Tieghemostelium lacteum TaxID=361077 RepID=A0A152A9C1_TIELA|nr:dynactin [Tieghemostelium lacteum]|eukprot:KYR02819.1 dynactin [Tieghemostelium lacteum]